ncbi:MAG: DUF4174 domain-containing protein [Pseudomonadota bacterium]
MTRTIALLIGLAGAAQAADLSEESLDALRWEARPVVIFADSPNDPRVQEQLDMLDADEAELTLRDVVILVDTDPDAGSDLRQRLRPRDFMFVLIGKDGEVKYRKPNPVPVRELVRLIDRMPMRQREIEAERRSN